MRLPIEAYLINPAFLLLDKTITPEQFQNELIKYIKKLRAEINYLEISIESKIKLKRLFFLLSLRPNIFEALTKTFDTVIEGDELCDEIKPLKFSAKCVVTDKNISLDAGIFYQSVTGYAGFLENGKILLDLSRLCPISGVVIQRVIPLYVLDSNLLALLFEILNNTDELEKWWEALTTRLKDLLNPSDFTQDIFDRRVQPIPATSPLLFLSWAIAQHPILHYLLSQNPKLWKAISVEALCRSILDGRWKGYSPLFCLSLNSSGRELLKKLLEYNPELIKGISADALCRPVTQFHYADSSPLFWLSENPQGRSLLRILFDQNPGLRKTIPVETLLRVVSGGTSHRCFPLRCLYDDLEKYETLYWHKILYGLLKENAKLLEKPMIEEFIRSPMTEGPLAFRYELFDKYEMPGYINSEYFLYFNRFGSHFNMSYSWKLHLSLANIDDVPRVFDLIGFLLLEHFGLFKVVNSSNILKGRIEAVEKDVKVFLNRIQFTIYLVKINGQQFIEECDVLKIMQKISKILSDHNIDIGESPTWDAATVVPGFSLRNDKNFEKNEAGKYVYIKTSMVGNNYNPANRDNPYANLLLQKPKEFSPLEHFENFNAGTLEQLFFAIKLTLIAWLNEYVAVSKFPIDFLKEASTNFSDINFDVIRRKYKNRGSISEEIKQVVIVLQFVLDNNKSNFYLLNFQLSVVKHEKLLALCAKFEEKKKKIIKKCIDEVFWLSEMKNNLITEETKSIDCFFIKKLITRVKFNVNESTSAKKILKLKILIKRHYNDATADKILKTLDECTKVYEEKEVRLMATEFINAFDYIRTTVRLNDREKYIFIRSGNKTRHILNDDKLGTSEKFIQLKEIISNCFKELWISEEKTDSNFYQAIQQLKSLARNGEFDAMSSPMNALYRFNKFSYRTDSQGSHPPTLKQYTMFCISHSCFFKPPKFSSIKVKDESLIYSNESLVQLHDLYLSLPHKLPISVVSVFGEKEVQAIGKKIIQEFNGILNRPKDENVTRYVKESITEIEKDLQNYSMTVEKKMIQLKAVVFKLSKQLNIPHNELSDDIEQALERIKKVSLEPLNGGCLLI